MSLRLLKFKPKLQLNSVAKNKSDDNSKPSIKAVSDEKKNVSSDSNPTVAEVLLVEEVKGEQKKSEEITTLKENVHVLPNDSEVYNSFQSSSDTVDISPKTVVENISNVSISKSNCNVIPTVPVADLHIIDSLSHAVSSDVLVDNLKGSSSDTTAPASPSNRKSVECSENESGSDLEDNVTPSVLSDSNRKVKSLINYDVLNKISSGVQQLNSESQNKDLPNVVEKDCHEVIVNDGSKAALNDSTEKINDNNRSEKKSVEREEDNICPVKVSNVLNKENLELSKNNKQSILSAKGNNGSKPKKRKKQEGKNTDTTPSKVSIPQRTNFKPNVAALGKIRRPEKFTPSSYSKMGSLAKEQFLKKFGKQQEPDASKLTMMDLIFYNPSTNPMPQSSDKKLLNTFKNSANIEKMEDKNHDEVQDKDRDENNGEETDDNTDDALPVPQLKISADGKVIVAQESLVIKPSNNLENFNFETVIDSELKKRKPVKNPNRCGWSHLDTIKFYKALNSLGCDFETMQSIFPDRSRRNLKSKFKKEEKLHGSLINKVLSRHSEFDLANVVRELEIDTVYKDTIKTYGRGFTETEKRTKGRKKQLSSVVAGKSSKKKDGDESDDSISDEEFCRKKKKVDLNLLSKMSEALGLNDENNSSTVENDRLSNSESSDIGNLKENVKTKRKRRKLIEIIESDSDFERDLELSETEDKKSSNQFLRRTPRIVLRRKPKPPAERIQSKKVVLRLEDLMDFNDESIKEPEPKSQTEIINDNHIVINTNIEFENVKYTRYISYNSNNLENPIEINETVAHVD